MHDTNCPGTVATQQKQAHIILHLRERMHSHLGSELALFSALAVKFVMVG